LNKIEFLKSLGFTPISKDLNHKLEVRCEKGHVFKRKFESFKNGIIFCPICEKEKKIEFLNGLGFTPVSKDLSHELEVKCEKGHTFRRSLKNLGLLE
jgi:N-acetylglutamate synthase-like GNAT family acetyltransferase